MLVRESTNGKEFDLLQIYYINTWINELLPLGANSNTSKYDDINDWKSYPKDEEYCKISE